MESKPLVYVHGPGRIPYMDMFRRAGYAGTNELDKASIICFTGGEDVNPALYGENNRIINGRPISYINSDRDDVDAFVFGVGMANKALMVGICRGGQFLNVMNGGRMWQHCDGHAGGPHNLLDTTTGEIVRVTSTHHQMMRPAESGDILAVAREASYKYADPDEWHIEHDAESNPGLLDDIEVVWYSDSRSLCFQPHPEHIGADDCRAYFFSLIERFL